MVERVETNVVERVETNVVVMRTAKGNLGIVISEDNCIGKSGQGDGL